MRDPVISGLEFDDDAKDAAEPAMPKPPKSEPSTSKRMTSSEIRLAFQALDLRLAAIEKAVPSMWEKRLGLAFGGITAAALSAILKHLTGVDIDLGGIAAPLIHLADRFTP